VLLRNYPEKSAFFEATHQIVIGMQLGKQEATEYSKVRVLHMSRIVIRTEVKYPIGANVLNLQQ
jgi:hypothetical protein